MQEMERAHIKNTKMAKFEVPSIKEYLAYGWRGKIKLTNQDSAGGKNFAVLTSM